MSPLSVVIRRNQKTPKSESKHRDYQSLHYEQSENKQDIQSKLR